MDGVVLRVVTVAAVIEDGHAVAWTGDIDPLTHDGFVAGLIALDHAVGDFRRHLVRLSVDGKVRLEEGRALVPVERHGHIDARHAGHQADVLGKLGVAEAADDANGGARRTVLSDFHAGGFIDTPTSCR